MPRVLVVEDHAPMRDLLVAIVRGAIPDAFVDIAADGLAGLEQVQSFDYNLIITDHRVPRVSGASMITAIRASNNPVPIIAVSGSIAAKQECMAAGANLFVDKATGLMGIGKSAASLLGQLAEV